MSLREHHLYLRTEHGFSFASREVYDHDTCGKYWRIFFEMCRESLT